MNEEENARAVEEYITRLVDARIDRVMRLKQQMLQGGNYEIDYKHIREEDYVGSILTGLSKKRDNIRRRYTYLPPVVAEAVTAVEAMIKRFPDPLQGELKDTLEMFLDYSAAEDGRAIGDFITALSKRGTKHYPHIPIEGDEEEGVI